MGYNTLNLFAEDTADDFYGFDGFIQEVVERINDMLPDDSSVFSHSILKNNNVVLKGIIMEREGVNASPTIYMESYYTSYLNGTDIDEIASNIMDIFSRVSLNEKLDMDFFFDYDKVKDSLACKIISLSGNKELLQDVPYEKFLDLAIVPYCKAKHLPFGDGTILIHNSHIDMWNKTKDEVICEAIENTRKIMKFKITPIMDILKKSGIIFPDDYDAEPDVPMFVVSNEEGVFGSIFMALGETVTEISRKLGGDFYLLPSSVHESILLPAVAKNDLDALSAMVREVNDTSMDAQDVLSDRAYYYNSSKGIFV